MICWVFRLEPREGNGGAASGEQKHSGSRSDDYQWYVVRGSGSSKHRFRGGHDSGLGRLYGRSVHGRNTQKDRCEKGMLGSGIPVQSQVSWRVQIYVQVRSASVTNPKNNTRVDLLLLGTLETVTHE